MKLSVPQKRLLGALRAHGPMRVSGNGLRTARSLEKRGLVRVTVGGSGMAYSGHWWYQAEAADGIETRDASV